MGICCLEEVILGYVEVECALHSSPLPSKLSEKGFSIEEAILPKRK
jgi:hypothetical protein